MMDEPFMEPSLLSIQDYVDEIIVVDASRKPNEEELLEIIKIPFHYEYTMPNYGEQMRIAIENTSYQWILKWDADFVSYPEKISSLLHQVKNLPNKHYYIEFFVLSVEYDLFHVGSNPYKKEAYLFTYSPQLLKRSRFRELRRRWRSLVKGSLLSRTPYIPFPFWYKHIIINDCFLMHLHTVKSPARNLIRRCQAQWSLLSDAKRLAFGSLDQYAKHCVSNNKLLLDPLPRQLYPFEGEHPPHLRQWVWEQSSMNLEPTEAFRKWLKEWLDTN